MSDPIPTYRPYHKVCTRIRRNEYRPVVGRLYNTQKWKTNRLHYLLTHPRCIRCLVKGKSVPATLVDHIIPERVNPDLFFEFSNYQALCKPCHDEKSIEDKINYPEFY